MIKPSYKSKMYKCEGVITHKKIEVMKRKGIKGIMKVMCVIFNTNEGVIARN